jgi:hypothetical protein
LDSHDVCQPGRQNLYDCVFHINLIDVVGAGGTTIESGLIPPWFDFQIHLLSGTSRLTLCAMASSLCGLFLLETSGPFASEVARLNSP